MKISSLLLFVAIAASSSTLILADECTTDDLTTISNLYSSAMTDGTSACPDLTSANDATSTDYCTSDCIDFMSGMLDELPDCSTGGVNIKAGLQAAIDYCETGTADTSDVLTGSAGTAGSSTSTKTDSTTSDKVTANTVPSATGSSTASSISSTIPSVVFAVAAFIGAAGL